MIKIIRSYEIFKTETRSNLLPSKLELCSEVIDFTASYSSRIYTDDESVKTRTRAKIEERPLNSESVLELDVKADNGFAIHLKPLSDK